MSDQKIYISSVEGNTQCLDGGAMFGNAPRVMWEKWLTPDVEGRIPLACRCMLIEYGDTKILCETGVGAFFEPKMAERFGVETAERHLLLENLEKRGIKDTDIDYVILSHLHFDHAGGLLSRFVEGEESKLLFPNARYIVGKTAFSRSEKPHSRDRASFIPGLSEKLIASDRLIQVYEGEAVSGLLEERLQFIFTDGHTPGQMHVLLKGEKEQVFFCGDLVPGRAWVHASITMGYDRFAEKVVDEKKDLMQKAAADSWILFYTHDPEISASYCSVSDKGRFIPAQEMKVLDRYEL